MLYFVSMIHQSHKTITGFNESQFRLKFPNPSRAFCLLLLFKCVQILLIILGEVRYKPAQKDHGRMSVLKNKAAPWQGGTTKVFPVITKGAFRRKPSSPNSLQYE